MSTGDFEQVELSPCRVVPYLAKLVHHGRENESPIAFEDKIRKRRKPKFKGLFFRRNDPASIAAMDLAALSARRGADEGHPLRAPRVPRGLLRVLGRHHAIRATGTTPFSAVTTMF